MRYSQSTTAKRHGVVYTPPELAQFVAQQMLKYHTQQNSACSCGGVASPVVQDVATNVPLEAMVTANSTSSPTAQATSAALEVEQGEVALLQQSKHSLVKVLDPAVGGGELLIAMAQQLLAQGCTHLHLVGYDTDARVAQETQQRLMDLFPQAQVDIRGGDFLAAVATQQVEQFDYVIANPPYVRTQILGQPRAQEILSQLQLSGRVDIYYAFLLYTQAVLLPHGIAGYITSNKFMTIQAGQTVRKFMLENYQLHHIWDLGDTQLFKAAVLPCVLLFSHGTTQATDQVNFTSVYATATYADIDSGVAAPAISPWTDLDRTGVFTFPNGKTYQIQQGKLSSLDPQLPWCIATAADTQFLQAVARNTVYTFATLGKIRVGIKSTADNVFIGDAWEQLGVNLELLRPLITHRHAGQLVANHAVRPWQVLYPHASRDGKAYALPLADYPHSQAYLLQHFEQLDGRNYVKQAKRQWYELWVPQNPAAWSKGKIVFRDIAEQPQFWWDDTGAVVNGDCYWIEIHPDTKLELVYLALAVANSKFIEKYYDLKFNNKIYGNKRRFQSQYVEQFPLPSLTSVAAQEAIQLVQKVIAAQTLLRSDKQRLDELVMQMFSA